LLFSVPLLAVGHTESFRLNFKGEDRHDHLTVSRSRDRRFYNMVVSKMTKAKMGSLHQESPICAQDIKRKLRDYGFWNYGCLPQT
jgi:hypothetical protein